MAISPRITSSQQKASSALNSSPEVREHFIIKGLGGKRQLKGTIAVRGAKNAALKILAAPFLFSDTLYVENIPQIEDIERLLDILKALGVSVSSHSSKYGFALALDATGILQNKLPRVLAKRLRASIVLTGPILARTGRVLFPHPGGCLIGARPIDIFLDGFKKLGASVKEKNGWYDITAPRGGLHGATIRFVNPSVTATETLMMAAVLAKGKTVLKNVALEPEIEALADFLNQCGARIQGAGTTTIEIMGTPLLRASGKVYKTPPDRIEAGSFLILGALAAKDLRITGCEPSHVEALIDVLELAGVNVEVGDGTLRVKNNSHPKHFKSFDIKTHEYPGFPTDLQAPIVTFLTQVSGQALVFETIFEGRLSYVPELVRMGADIQVCDPHRVIVRGPTALSGHELESPDLRAGLACLIAAIVAKGESVIHNVYTIDRGYEQIEERLLGIGVDIKRITNS